MNQDTDQTSASERDAIKEISDLKRALDESAIVAMTDQTGRITYVNDKFCDIAKYSREELIGQDHRIINSGFHPPEFIRSIWTTIANGKIWRGELRNKAKDGSIYWVDTTIVPFLDDERKPFQYVAIRYEVTERKLAEERIRQQASLLDKTQDAILVCDLNFQILYWNKSAERIYGFTAEETFGRLVSDMLCGGDGQYLRQAKDSLAAHDEWNSETRHLRRDGESISIESRWTLVRDDKGEPDYYLIALTDITEQKRTEEHLLRAQRMESIGTLAGGIAHDLNNILSPVMMAVDMLMMNGPDDDAKRWLSMIKENAERGADLIKQVLTFARGMDGERVQVRLKHIIKDLVGVLSETVSRSISVKYDVDPELWTISADPTQIHQVLMNVCLNARDAMPSGGTLSIKAENIVVDENYARMNIDANQGGHVRITITDTGSGMTKEVLERIFDPFFTTKEFGKGTGLGLATTMTIVKSHGGFINVYSEPRKGTRFDIYFPSVETPSERDAAPSETEMPTGNGELILVVDDEESIRMAAKATLERFGYQVETAIDGTDALAVYTQSDARIDLVMTDLAMPYMDGTSLIRALKKIDPNIKIAAMSGLLSEGQTVELKELGVEAFLSKPYTAKSLLNLIHGLLTPQ
ncbi:MAG: PAS domain S-box protein [Blastocatellia bacterium]|nr:PAS domain S-box protein [Blastocatellia bacterium]